MQTAETLLAIYGERGRHGKPLEGVYRQLFNSELYLRAYYRLAKNEGAMTRGATEETVDAMSMERIQGIIELLRHERYRWTPVRRVLIPKGNGKLRPLGIPSWSDKLLQEVGNEREVLTHPERLILTHLVLQDSRSGQGRQFRFTPPFGSSWTSSTRESGSSRRSSRRSGNDASGGPKAPRSSARPGRSGSTR